MRFLLPSLLPCVFASIFTHPFSCINVTFYPHFVNILEHIWFTFHSQKSIFTQQKSIIPLFSCPSGRYNTFTLQAAQRCFCNLLLQNFHLHDNTEDIDNERNHKRTDPAVHGRLQYPAEAHRTLMTDLIIFISLFGGIYYMNMRNNLIRSMQTIGQMRAVIGE